MRLTRHTDYGLRVLLYLALHQERRATVREISANFSISQNHLVKIVGTLSEGGYLRTRRGSGGGLTLARPPERIVLGDVIRHSEPGLELVDCNDPPCPIAEACRLKRALDEACAAFLAVLDGYTLADLIGDRRLLLRLTGGERPQPH
jgi:Rrf2 family nitric oxide-sensitive transcriptional repressor